MNEPQVFACGMAAFIVWSVLLLAVEEPMRVISGQRWLWKAMMAIDFGVATYFVVRFVRWAI